MGRNNISHDGISVRENFDRYNMEMNEKNEKSTKRNSSRPEMKGPSDISDILSGLKTKTINIQETPNIQSNNPRELNDDSSTISINELKDLQAEANLPKRSRRRQKSSSNTISLDI
jgi:hypothetical protein